MVRKWLIPVLLSLLFGMAGGPAFAQDAPKETTIKADTTPEVAPEASPVPAASPAPASAPDKGDVGIGKGSILGLFTKVNPMLWVLGLCSVVTIGYIMERLVALRKSRVIPKDFVDRFMERLSAGKLDRDRATELCRANDSPAARIFAHVVRYWGMPAASIRQALEGDAAGEVLDLKRNVRVLNGASTLAPLLGLLGTVIGMIESFDSLKSASGGKSEALAHGISLALVSTAIGLIIAAVAVTMYYYFLNRIDILVRQLDDQARRVIDLISSEAIRPSADRRSGLAGDHARHESRIH